MTMQPPSRRIGCQRVWRPSERGYRITSVLALVLLGRYTGNRSRQWQIQFVWRGLAIVFVLASIRIDPVSGNATLSGTAAGRAISLSTRSRTATAVYSLVWNGRNFLDDFDHGRQLQSATNHGVVGHAYASEGYNPTQAGSVNNGVGSTSTSTVIAETVAGNQLITSGAMAFWQAPGQTNPAGATAYNTTVLSNHIVSTTYTLGVNVNGSVIDNLIRHDVTFSIPSSPPVQFFYHQMEALTGYMPPSFSRFRTWDPATNLLSVITPPNAEQPLPIIVSTPDDQFAMGIYSFQLPQSSHSSAGYGAFFYPDAASNAGLHAGVAKWNVVYREGNPNQPENLQAQNDFSYSQYLAVGTVQDVRNAFARLVGIPSAADFNGDGFVDGQDLLTWTSSFGSNAEADADGDGDSDGSDFLSWQRSNGLSETVVTSHSDVETVSEPSVLALLLSIAVIAAIRRDWNALWRGCDCWQ